MRVSLVTNTSPPRSQQRRWWLSVRKYLPIYLLIVPGMALFLVWTMFPLIYAFVMSFFQWNPNPAATSPFSGLENYTRALRDPIFYQALRNTFLYTVITVVGQMAAGLAVAVLLNSRIVGRSFFRIFYYLPVVCSWVVVSIIFSYIFSTGGLVDYVFGNVLHLISPQQNWLGDTTLALPTLMILGVWKGVGWNMVIFLAGLQGIPSEIYEAARVDGASSWQLFTRITLPLLRPTISFASVILTIGAFGTFIPMFVLTKGGPLHSTETLLTYAYTNAFSSFDFGYGAALTYMFAALIFVLAIIQIRVTRARTQS
jgi:multiple sugar transport system permease protein